MFATLLSVIVGGLINKIIEETQINEDEAFNKLYNSALLRRARKGKNQGVDIQCSKTV